MRVTLLPLALLLAAVAAAHARSLDVRGYRGRELAQDTSSLSPQSPSCAAHTDFTRYVRVASYDALRAAIDAAEPGDMIELEAGEYFVASVSSSTTDLSNPSAGDADVEGAAAAPGPASEATIFNKHGTPIAPITICGPAEAVLDGTAPTGGFADYALRLAQSSFVRVAGLSLRNALRGVDIQASHHCQLIGLTISYTLGEGLRLRFSSQYNAVFGCAISNTGRAAAVLGEGVYVGSSKAHTVLAGLAPDASSYNTIRRCAFGPGVTAENVDVKEFSAEGEISGNAFDGRDIDGYKAGAAWVAVRGNGWAVHNNTGSGLRGMGAGFLIGGGEIDGQGQLNRVDANRCEGLPEGAFCVYVAPGAENNAVACTNKVVGSGAKACNCERQCGRSATVLVEGPVGATIGLGGTSYAVPRLVSLHEDAEARPVWVEA